MYPEYILKMLRQYFGLDEDDTRLDDSFAAISPTDVFSFVCDWDGLICYGPTLIHWVEDIFHVELDK